jgi:2-polyprenyl-3-methyl-5-hydroxy-6-metoxy-1,4-benzoquinol methylase
MNTQEKSLIDTLKTVLFEFSTDAKATEDFTKTFNRIGIEPRKARNLADSVMSYINKAQHLKEAEKNIKKLFTTEICSGKNIFQMIQAGLQGRFEIIFNQLYPHLSGVQRVIDFGCGSGVLTQMLHDRCNINIDGVDVRDYRAKEVSIPFLRLFPGFMVFNQDYTQVPSKYYDCAILTNVLHHEVDNEKILVELNRIVSKKLVIIETVPEAEDLESARKDWGRMLFNDVLWNRFFHYENIPVPGTYEIPSNWIKRFEKYGWKCTYSEDLGFDQPTIQDRHHLLVFER